MSRAADGWGDVAVEHAVPPTDGISVPAQYRHPSRASRPADASAEGDAAGAVVDGVVDGAVALLVVAAGIVRRAAEVAVRTRRKVLPRLPLPGAGSGVRRVLRAPAVRLLVHPASSTVLTLAAAADRLVPEVTRAVLARLDVPALVHEFADLDRLAVPLDVDAIVARVDLDAVLDRVDLDALLDRVDLDAVVARVDLDALTDKVDVSRILDRVDLDAIIARLDLDALVDKVDVTRVIDRVDLDAVVDRVDVSRVVDRVDLDAVVDRVDLDRAVHRVDLDAVVDRVDLDRAVDRVDVDRVIARTDVAGLARYVVEEIDLNGLLRASTGSVSSEMVRNVRDQGADADRAVERVVDRLLHRSGRRSGTADARRRDHQEGGT